MQENKNKKSLFYKTDFQKIIGDLFCLLVFLTPLYFNLSTAEPFEFHKTTLVFGFTVVLSTLWFLYFLQQKKLTISKNIIPLLVIIFFAINLISYVFSVHPYSSLWGNYWRFNGGIASLFSYTLLFLVFISSIGDNKEIRKNILKSIVLSGVFVSAYAVFQAFQYRSLDFRAISTFGQPNFLAAYLVFVIPLTIYLALESKEKILPRLLFFLIIVEFFVLLLTQSRAGWFGFALAAIAFIFIYRKKIFRKEKVKYLVLSIFCLIALLIPFKKNIQNRINLNLFTEVNQQEVKNGTLSLRLFAWEGAFKTFLDYPLFGSGPETMFFVIPRYVSAEKNNHLEWDFRFDKAHNEPLDVLANTGLLAFLAYAALIWIVTARLLKSKGDQERFVGLAFLGLFGTNLFGFSCVVAALYFWIAISFSASQENMSKIRIPRNKKTFLILLVPILASITLVYSWSKIYYANALFSKGSLFETTLINPNLDYYRGSLAIQYLNGGDRNSALEESEKAVQLNPLNSDNYRVLFIINKKEDPNKAIEAINKVIELDPNNAQPYYEKGAFLLEIGEKDSAKEYLEKALKLKIDYSAARELLDKTN